MTMQSFKDECDIHQILERFEATGIVTHVKKFDGQYGFANSETFYDHMQTVATAQTMFEELPQPAQEFFEGDPGRFLDYMENASGDEARQKLEDIGLLSHSARRAELKRDQEEARPEKGAAPPAPPPESPSSDENA